MSDNHDDDELHGLFGFPTDAEERHEVNRIRPRMGWPGAAAIIVGFGLLFASMPSGKDLQSKKRHPNIPAASTVSHP